jgi:hypothetical protein
MRPNRIIKLLLLLVSLFIVGLLVLGSESGTLPKFSAADRKTVDGYYTRELGNLAPGSLDRKGFPPQIESALKPGARLPEQLEKQLEMLPKELESKLSAPPGGYQLYKLGHHVLILHRSDLQIADIIKDAGWK